MEKPPPSLDLFLTNFTKFNFVFDDKSINSPPPSLETEILSSNNKEKREIC